MNTQKVFTEYKYNNVFKYKFKGIYLLFILYIHDNIEY